MFAPRRIRFVFVLFALIAGWSAVAAADGKFVDRVYRDDDGEHRYVVYEPEGYSAEKKWPVLLFLHGAGERGNDGRKQLDEGLGRVLASRTEPFPFVVVFPQCEETRAPILSAWNSDAPDGRRAIAILDEVLKEYSIDEQRQCLTGWSMGGFGAADLAGAFPERWKSVAILSGGGVPRFPAALAKVPIWAFHGERDRVVLADESQKLVDALRAANGTPRYTRLPSGEHWIWTDVYRWDGLYRWLLDPTLDVEFPMQTSQPGQRPRVAADDDEEFVPALEIPEAVYLRMGNDMLTALAGSVPSKIPEDLLTGRIDDMYDSTTTQGRSFGIWFSNIRYSGKVTRAHVEAYRKDRLNIQLGLSDILIRIGRADVSGSGRSAVTGHIDVVIGHRAPVWLSIALEPYVENRKLRLRLIASRFDIPRDNWYVTSPAGVSTRGLGMTSEAVSSGLVNGLYGSKGRIEREVEAIVPGILAKLEENLDLTQAGEFLNSFWPLPVYQPRIQLWPQAVRTDEQGVSILFGLTAAAFEPENAPERPIVRSIAPIRLENLTPTSDLQLGLGTELLTPLTQMLIDDNVARVHLSDIPGESFQPLLDRSRLERAIPALKEFDPAAEIWAELILRRPLELVDAEDSLRAPPPDGAGNSASNGPKFRFEIPTTTIAFAVRNRSDEEWLPLAEFDVSLSQGAGFDVEKLDFVKRALTLELDSGFEVSARGRFLAENGVSDARLDESAIGELFRECWDRWLGSERQKDIEIPDIDFGVTRLRLASADWSPPYLYAQFTPPGIKITNGSDGPLEYQIRSADSPWSDTLTLAPGRSHEFEGPAGFLYRTRGRDGYKVFTLPAGSHSTYRRPSEGGAAQLFLTAEE